MSSNGQGNQQSRLTYINLLKGYYSLEIPALVGAKPNSLFLALIFIANERGFIDEEGKPLELFIPNSVAVSKSGLSPSGLHTSRKVLMNLEIGGNNVLKYNIPKHSSQCGSYIIDYSILLDKPTFGFQYESQTKVKLNPNQTQTRSKLDPNQPQTESYQGDDKKSESIDIDKDIDKNKEINKEPIINNSYIALINKQCCTTWIPQSESQKDRLQELEEFPFDTFEPIFLETMKKKANLKPPGVVSYMLQVMRGKQGDSPPPKKLMDNFATGEELEAGLRAKGLKTLPNPSQLRNKPVDENEDLGY